MNLYVTRTYERAIRKLLSEDSRREMETAIVTRPEAAGNDHRTGDARMMTDERTETGCEIETALGEVLAHVRGETALPCRIVDDPAAERIVALRKRMKLSRRKFAERFGLDARAIQDWEQGRRSPDRAARVLLTVIDHEPDAVVRALTPPAG